VGGSFDSAGGATARRIARWNGSSWSAIGTGITFGRVEAIAEYDDGQGSAIYLGGQLTRAANNTTLRNLARWNFEEITSFGHAAHDAVQAFAVGDLGNGSRLFVGGEFLRAGPADILRIGMWNGQGWDRIGTGITGGPLDVVVTMHVHDDGGGPALYVGGRFQANSGPSTPNIGRWTPTGGWMPAGAGL